MDIIQTRNVYTGPWMLMGDFNCVWNNEEKRNGVLVSMYDMKDISECFDIAGLTDLKSSRCFLTWSNGRVWCKLDRVMVNQGWFMNDWNAQVNFQFPRSMSDHSMSLVSLFAEQELGRLPFKFFNMWTIHPEFQERVKDVWQGSFDGCMQYCFVKQQALKKSLRSLNALHYSHISARAERADAELMEIQSKLHDDPSCVELQEELRKKKCEAIRLESANRMFLSQLAKCKYMRHNDRNSSFFHVVLRRNRCKNHIAAVMKQNGELTKSYDQVAAEFVNYYSQLIGTECCSKINVRVVKRGPVLNDLRRNEMIQLILDEDIRMALFSIRDDKAPGPDGSLQVFIKRRRTLLVMNSVKL
ncbi:uncharacterized protein LOC131165952 [Malania oleifera]|uniref:uncharacterized protein LOC131165952 n=1 Tax=Malania oleifera TaxID=397392 RepID=UPI0025ADB8F1|nr:uncharacterized protein LOC131165952 [Malania oleifera]